MKQQNIDMYHITLFLCLFVISQMFSLSHEKKKNLMSQIIKQLSLPGKQPGKQQKNVKVTFLHKNETIITKNEKQIEH